MMARMCLVFPQSMGAPMIAPATAFAMMGLATVMKDTATSIALSKCALMAVHSMVSVSMELVSATLDLRARTAVNVPAPRIAPVTADAVRATVHAWRALEELIAPSSAAR